MADFDELKLTVSLTDDASAGLTNIRAQLTAITQQAGQVQTAFAGVSSSVTQLGSAAQQTHPHVRTVDQALKGLEKSAEEAARGVLEMGLAAREGAGGWAQMALGLRGATQGLSGVAEGMEALGASSRVAVLALGGVALGVLAVGAAVVAYGISVFRSEEHTSELQSPC